MSGRQRPINDTFEHFKYLGIINWSVTFTDILLSGQKFGTTCGFHGQNLRPPLIVLKKKMTITKDRLVSIFIKIKIFFRPF